MKTGLGFAGLTFTVGHSDKLRFSGGRRAGANVITLTKHETDHAFTFVDALTL
jgi:hypothetical protein